MSLRIFARRALIYTHRWSGIVLGALFITWFVSGVVLMYAQMPRLSRAERLARLPRLDFRTASATPLDAAAAVGYGIRTLRLGMFAGRPVYRLAGAEGSATVFADDGSELDPVNATAALAEARTFAPEANATIRYDGLVEQPDQWTLEIARTLPLHRVALGDPADTRLYFSERSGEIVMKTTAAERRWAYPGAILHWLYLTPLRRNAPAWAQIVIWASIAGTAMALTGLVWGIWRFSPQYHYRLKRQRARSPYAGWMHWHHYAGLIAGLTTVTWVFSGLLSMDPWDWHPSTSPTRAQREALIGGSLRLNDVSVAALQQALAGLDGAREAELVQFRGSLFLADAHHLISLADGRPVSSVDGDEIVQAVTKAGGATPVRDIVRLDRYDAYYYDRDGELPLPVVRVRYGDPQQTWLYVDAVRGTPLRKEERLTRLNRWLYHGLHSLDFPFLYYRRPLWDIVVIALSAGGLIVSVTTIVPAFRRFRRLVVRLKPDQQS
ncbi:MAG TPA: PepSY domain-containing protein [Vicinamibacterales bacterium]